jgi:hypothetical protein
MSSANSRPHFYVYLNNKSLYINFYLLIKVKLLLINNLKKKRFWDSFIEVGDLFGILIGPLSVSDTTESFGH